MRIAAAKDGSLLATRTQKVDSHLAVVTGAVVLAHEDVHKRKEAFVEMVGKGKRLPVLPVCGAVGRQLQYNVRWVACSVG